MADKKHPERDHLSDALIEWAPKINMHVKKLRSQGIPTHVEDTDLHTAGMDGLMDAFHRYDKSKGSFMSFVNARIRGKMLDHVTASGGSNAVDKLFRDQARSFKSKQAAATPQEPSESSED